MGSEEAQISRNRRAISYGDKKLMHNMVPGYTGYIPKKEDHFGNRYAVGCHRAISNFENDRTAYSRNESERLQVAAKPPQKALRTEPAPYVSVKQAQHSVSLTSWTVAIRAKHSCLATQDSFLVLDLILLMFTKMLLAPLCRSSQKTGPAKNNLR